MLTRQNAGARPQITFTSDFHQLVQGDLVPGPCVLRYDPLRLISRDDPEPSHRIEAHVRFHPNGSEWHGQLIAPDLSRYVADEDPAGQGLMLETAFTIPETADELEVWFSCAHDDGQVRWDSAHGKNYWLRFGLKDIAIQKAEVRSGEPQNAAQDLLLLDLATLKKVEAVSARWRVTNIPEMPRQVSPLVCTGTAGNQKHWKSPGAGIPVPQRATVAFDLVYYVDDRLFTDDNQGRWYIAE